MDKLEKILNPAYWMRVYCDGDLYVIHADFKEEVENFLDTLRTPDKIFETDADQLCQIICNRQAYMIHIDDKAKMEEFLFNRKTTIEDIHKILQSLSNDKKNIPKGWIKVFYNDKLYILNENYKTDLENFSAGYKIIIKDLQRTCGDISDVVK